MKKRNIIIATALMGMLLVGCNAPAPDQGGGSGGQVTPQVVHVTGVTIDQGTTNVMVGQSTTFTATVSPANATNKEVTWTSGDTNIFTVNNGVVTGVAPGSALLTVTTVDGNRTYSILVVVDPIPVVHVAGVSLDKTSATLEIGETVTLNATVSPENADDKSVTWTSSNQSVATVNNGVVTAVGAGNATITVKTTDGNKTATANITVNAPAPTTRKATVIDEKSFLKTFEARIDGSYVTLNANTDTSGISYDIPVETTCKLTFNDIEGWLVDKVLIDDDEYSLNTNGDLVFSMDFESDFTIEIVATADVPSTGSIGFVVKGGEHLNPTFYSDAALTKKVTGGEPSKRYYITVTPEEGYGLTVITASRKLTDVGSPSEVVMHRIDELTYSFDCTPAWDNKITFNIVEVDLSLFEGADYLGDYIVYQTYGYSAHSSDANAMKNDLFRIDASGHLTFGENNASIIEVQESKLRVTNSGNNTSIYCKNGIAIFEKYSFDQNGYHNSFGDGLGSSSGSCVAIKKMNVTDSNDMYTSDNTFMTIGGAKYGVLSIKRDGVPYRTIFIDHNNNNVYTEVTIDKFHGETLDDRQAAFRVSKGNQTLLEVTYDDQTRVLGESIMGVYSMTDGSDTMTLVVPNRSEAFLNNNKVTIIESNGNEITIVTDTHKYVVVLDPSTGVATISSKVENSTEEIDLRGKTFVGQGIDTYWGGNAPARIVFENYDTEIRGTLYFATGGFTYFFKFTATLNVGTGAMVLNIYEGGYGNTSYAWVISGARTIINARLNGNSITILDDIKNVYTTKNTVVTCADL